MYLYTIFFACYQQKRYQNLILVLKLALCLPRNDRGSQIAQLEIGIFSN